MAQFHSIYGASAYRHSSYPTEDHCIPFRLFFAMYSCLPNIKAYEVVGQIEAGTVAYANVMGDKKGQQKILKLIKTFIDQAEGRE